MIHLIRNLRCRVLATFVVLLVGCLLCPGSALGQRLSQAVVPEHYELRVTPDLTAASFKGEEKIDVMVAQATNSITLNAAEIAFDSVTGEVNGRKLKAKVTLDQKKEQATLSFAREIAPGRMTLSIEYSGILNNQLRGFYLSKTAKRNYAVTQFEATDARRAFPCFDEPAFKATYDVTLIVNKGDTAISNTNIIADKPGPLASQHTIQFAMTPKMSTYLLAFLVGDFDCISGESDGVPIRVCGTPGKGPTGQYALIAAEHFLHYYDQYFGIKYPMPKLDLIGLPDFEAGAMENFGAITYRETVLLVDEKTAPLRQKQGVAVTVAHEMAHQWFGDMVTMQWWDNLWLNEGFATWMENKAVGDWKPEWKISQGVASDVQFTLDYDSRMETRTIRASADTPAEITQMFDGIAYGKAGAILLMVENYEGEETFRQGVHKYLAGHMYANASAEDFWNAQTAVSHKPVDDIMQSFVTKPGAPLLTFGEPREKAVGVSQERFFLNPDQGKGLVRQSWMVPVCVHSTGGAPVCTVVSAAHPALPFTGEQLFFANAGGKGYYRSSYPADQLAKLEAGIESELSTEERVSLLGDQLALMHADKVPVGSYLDLVAAVRDDTSDDVMVGVITGAATAQWLIASDAQEREAMAAWIQRTFGPALDRLGMPVAGEPYEKTALRTTLFRAVGELGRDPQVLDRARRIASQYLDEPASADHDLAPAALRMTARTGDAALFDRVQRLYETSTDSTIQSDALYSLADFRDPVLVKRTLDYAVSDKVRSQNFTGLVGSELGNIETRDLAWQYIQANWAKIAPRVVVGFGSSGLVRAAGSFCSVQGRDQVTTFFATHKVEASERALKSAVGSINDCIALRAAQGPALREWLAKQK